MGRNPSIRCVSICTALLYLATQSTSGLRDCTQHNPHQLDDEMASRQHRKKAAATLLEHNAFVAQAPQERQIRVDERPTSPRYVEKTEVVVVAFVGVTEQAGHGLRRPLADVGVGAEDEPRP